MLDEGVQIMNQLSTTGTATLDGKALPGFNGAICRPLPPALQDGGIPLWIAGKRRGEEDRCCGSPPGTPEYCTNFDGTPEVFRHCKSEVLAGHRRELGTDFDAIPARSANYNVILGATDKDVQDKIAC